MSNFYNKLKFLAFFFHLFCKKESAEIFIYRNCSKCSYSYYTFPLDEFSPSKNLKIEIFAKKRRKKKKRIVVIICFFISYININVVTIQTYTFPAFNLYVSINWCKDCCIKIMNPKFLYYWSKMNFDGPLYPKNLIILIETL